MTRPLLIAGCGYLGGALARRALEQGREVLGLCQREESARELRDAGIAARAVSLTDEAGLLELAANWPRETALVHCAASGRGGGSEAYRKVYLEGMRNLLAAFPSAARVVFTSSTSVYAQTDGSVVNESTPAEPDRETGRVLRAAEDETMAAGGTVLRLAGIYGPGRSVLLRNFLAGESVIEVRTEPPATPDGRWVNQIHRDDAARALLLLLESEAASGQVLNAADSTPMLQRTLFNELALRFSRPLPREAAPDAGRKRGWTHKRVDAARLRALGWKPQFPSWFDALDADAALIPSILAQLE